MADTSTASDGGIGVSGLLGIAFVVLKLTHVIAWSWWWVTAPFWIPLGCVIVILGVFVIYHLLWGSK